MKNWILVLVILVVPFISANASIENCRMNFMDNFQADSKSFQISDESLMADFDDNPKAYSIESVEELSESLSSKSGLSCLLSISKAACNEIVPGVSSSMACYLESEIGYFIISKDMLSGVNIIFSRWD